MSGSLFVIVATAGRPKLLARTLSSLAACELPTTYRATIVVENGREGGARDVVESCSPRLKAGYLHVRVQNKSLALNAAVELVEDGLIFFADDDVRFHPELLTRYAEAATGLTRGRFFGGPVGVDYEEEPPDWLKPRLPCSARGWGLSGRLEDETWSLPLGMNWAAFAHDLKTAGGFDPEFGPGSPMNATGQETNMQWRLLEMGVELVFVPEAIVWHHVPVARCSPDWATERRYREGMSRGLWAAARGGPGRLFGYTRRTCVAWVLLAACRALSALHWNPVTRFDARLHYRFHSGFIRGYRAGRWDSFGRKKEERRHLS